MALPLDKFVQQLQDSGVIAADTLLEFLPPKASPKDAEDLARELVRNKKLTRFQAEAISRGKAKDLVLGNYVVIDKIGQGGMGAVYKAEHRRMKRQVAIKMLPAATLKDATAVARFQREVEAAAKLFHPNIVPALDADEANGVHFLVMEFVAGKDLAAFVKQHGPLPVAQAVDLIVQAARGLEYAHKKGIVHRDIKPANLLLDDEGTVKILDMGLARIDGNTAAQAELTGTGAIMGTVDYMAPEQALSTRHADGRADIYSLGCSLCYLLTGKPTYDGETLTARLLAHQAEPIPSLTAIRSEVPPEVDAIFRKMVAKKVADRYQSMSEVLSDLEVVSGSRGTGAQTATFLPSPSPLTATSSSAAGGTTASVVVSQSALTRQSEDTASNLMMVGDATVIALPASSPSSSAVRKRRMRTQSGIIAAAMTGAIVLIAVIVISLRVSDGTIEVTVDQPDARVRVLDMEGKVEIDQAGGKQPVTISLDVGKHRLVVEKEGFRVFGEEIQIQSGNNKPITARLVPNIVETKQEKINPAKLAAWAQPEFVQWQQKVAALPADTQVEQVVKKLKELNPGYDGTFDRSTYGTANNEYFQCFSNSINDISPVRAFKSLKNLGLYPTLFSRSTLTDLTPLQGMSLQALTIAGTSVVDLAPIKGLPLIDLSCGGTPLKDLSHLKGLPLQRLDLSQTLVSDLEPVRGMMLKFLSCDRSFVTDLAPLEGMPLETIILSPAQIRNGMEVLRKMPSLQTIGILKDQKWPAAEFWQKYDAGHFPSRIALDQPAFKDWLDATQQLPASHQLEAVQKKLQQLNPEFDGKLDSTGSAPTPVVNDGTVVDLRILSNHVSDISPLRALTGIRKLALMGSDVGMGRVSDLTPLKGLPIRELELHYIDMADLSPLRGMQLTFLSMRHNRLTDLSALQGMPLEILQFSGNHISSLAPLRGMPLKYLQMGNTLIHDLTPLQGMQLEGLDLTLTPVTDLTPIKGQPVKYLNVASTLVSDLTPVKEMPLEHLEIAGSRVTDLSPLRGMPIKRIGGTFKSDPDLEILKSLKMLETINGKPAAEFWKTANSANNSP